jgi:hypothetical protein
MDRPKVLLCVPVYKPFSSKVYRKSKKTNVVMPKGLFHPMTQRSIEGTIGHSRERVQLGISQILGDACLTRARSLLYAEYRLAREQNGGLDYLWMVDADVSWPPDTLERLIAHDKPLVGAAYAFRERDAEKRRVSATRFRPDREPDADTGLVEVDGINGGCMLIRDDLLQEMEAAYPELAFMTNPPRMLRTYGFWNFSVTPYPEWIGHIHPELEGENEFVSEDWAFSHRARAVMGATPLIDLTIHLGHWDGSKVYQFGHGG